MEWKFEMIIRVWMNPTRQTSKLRSRYVEEEHSSEIRIYADPKFSRERKLVVVLNKNLPQYYIDFIFNPCNFIFTLKNAIPFCQAQTLNFARNEKEEE